ncbi:MAG: transposase family protein [Saprospiraceae bacterium]|nr:transposase family protein [Saprospiraceae bacterium]
MIKRGYTIREFRDVPIGLRAVRLIAKVYRLECKNCLKLRQEKLSFAEKKKLHE